MRAVKAMIDTPGRRAESAVWISPPNDHRYVSIGGLVRSWRAVARVQVVPVRLAGRAPRSTRSRWSGWCFAWPRW